MIMDKKKNSGILDYLRSKRKMPLLIGGAVLGILLLILGGLGGGKVAEDAAPADRTSMESAALESFAAHTEQELEALCEAVSGVSDAVVMVTLSRGYRVQYAADEKGAPLTVGSGSSEEAVFDALLVPAIAGVGVVCRGGSRPAVQRELVELISTVLGISASRVYVTGK
jgi:hypothetical protein